VGAVAVKGRDRERVADEAEDGRETEDNERKDEREDGTLGLVDVERLRVAVLRRAVDDVGAGSGGGTIEGHVTVWTVVVASEMDGDVRRYGR